MRLELAIAFVALAGLRSEGAGRPTSADGPAGMVIVTDASLVTPFERLARAHERHGLDTRVRTLQSIRVAYPEGQDDAERIRRFLKDARAAWGIEFALMGGDEPLIPMHRVPLGAIAPVPHGIDLPTDQYYACLDGDRSDADADATPELCVGRAPVTDVRQADRFVEKTLRALVRAPDLALLVGSGGPGTFVLDKDGRREALYAEELLRLRHPRSQGHVVALSAFTCVPGRLSVGAALIRAEHGGCVSVLGPTDIEVPSLAYAFLQLYLERGMTGHAATIGEAMRAALRATRIPKGNGRVMLTTLGNVLLGDPALPFPVRAATAARSLSGARPSRPSAGPPGSAP